MQSSKRTVSGEEMYQLIERMYPICRSITGDGVRETLNILKDVIPIKVREVASGKKVLDWEVPPEWNIKDGWIKNEKGEKLVDFKKLNLHVLNYSIPIDKKVSLSELKEHVFTLPDYPDWVPYRTSYHTRNWGFCMSHNQFEKLADQEYHVKIESTIEPGSLTYGEFYIKGQTDEEMLFSTHICHPSLCNDNLSGLTIAAYLADYLSKRKNKYSYRFLFVPGTIGSITWLSQNEDKLDKIKFGLVLTLLGDTSKFYYKKSRRSDDDIDRIIENYLRNHTEDYSIIEFYPYGYDERQYCSPGYNLPVGRLSRTPHGEFPEYHTSADNLDLVKRDRLIESFELLQGIVDVIEHNKTYINLSPKGEPQLGKRGLFSKIGGLSDTKDRQMALLWVLNLSDGMHSLLDISERSGLSFQLINDAADSLKKVSLLREI